MVFTEEIIQQVWKKATKIDGYNPDFIRKDVCGAWIKQDAQGDHDSAFGWEVDHVYPVSLAGAENDKLYDMMNLLRCTGEITHQKVMTIQSISLPCHQRITQILILKNVSRSM